jgi:hypothetical protein
MHPKHKFADLMEFLKSTWPFIFGYPLITGSISISFFFDEVGFAYLINFIKIPKKMIHLQWFAADHPYLLYLTVSYVPPLALVTPEMNRKPNGTNFRSISWYILECIAVTHGLVVLWPEICVYSSLFISSNILSWIHCLSSCVNPQNEVLFFFDASGCMLIFSGLFFYYPRCLSRTSSAGTGDMMFPLSVSCIRHISPNEAILYILGSAVLRSCCAAPTIWII